MSYVAATKDVVIASAISAVFVFLIVINIIAAVRARGRPVATTTTTASGQLYTGRPAHAQSVMNVSSAPQSVNYPGVHFSSIESEAPPSYEEAIVHQSAIEAVNFEERSRDGSACDASNDIDCDCGCDCDGD